MWCFAQFAQFKKREKHPWRIVTSTLLKVTLILSNGTKSRKESHNLILHGKPDPLLKSSKYLAETSMFLPVQCGIDATVTNNVIIILTINFCLINTSND